MRYLTVEDTTELIEDYISNKTIKYITHKFDIDQSVLYRIIKLNDVKRIPTGYRSKTESIVSLYLTGSSCTQIAKQLGISRNHVSLILKENDIDSSVRRSKFTINEDILHEIDTFQKAQFLGLMFADGCIIKNTEVFCVSLKEDDLEYLQDINQYLQCTKPVTLMKKAGRRFFAKDNKYYATKNAYGIRVENKKIKEDLMKWGIVYNKSYVDFHIPSIDRKYINAFILGYFEGDGTIASSKIKNRKTISHNLSILCQPNFALDLQNIFKQELDIHAGIYIKKSQPLLRTVNISKVDDLIKLYHWLYDDAVFVMKRKHSKFVNILKFFENRGYEVGNLKEFGLYQNII